MATQGLITVLRDGKVIMKVIAGCNGYNAQKVADTIRRAGLGDCVAGIYGVARANQLGCQDCLVVQTADELFPPETDLGEDGASKFQVPRWNPRWQYGTADYNVAVEL